MTDTADPRVDAYIAPAFTAMAKHIIATNRAGGWRRVRRAGDATDRGDTR